MHKQLFSFRFLVVLWVCVGFSWAWLGWGCMPATSTEPSAEQPASADASTDEASPDSAWKPVVSKAADIAIEALRKVVPPSDGTFPAEVKAQTANNNLDVIDFEGRLFLAFRTAPSHFASDKVVLYIVSTQDQQSWALEAEIALNTDLREPRFFAWKGQLSMYFARLGSDPQAFEPGSTWRVFRRKQGEWGPPEEVYTDGFIPWRIKIFGDIPLMIGYTGGENIYKFNGKPLKVYLRTTSDGRTWVPFDANRPVVLEGGSSETDIALDNDGNLYAVARNEAGDKDGFGAKICRAPKADWSTWECKPDPKKYDSPLLFSHAGEIYLVGRRNVTETGHYDLMLKDEELTHANRATKYQLDYWKHPKRCSLWLVRRETLTVELLKDLPSKGDTCFPSVVPRGKDAFLLFNYSSDVDGPDVSWLSGQTSPTFIYSMMLALTAR